MQKWDLFSFIMLARTDRTQVFEKAVEKNFNSPHASHAYKINRIQK